MRFAILISIVAIAFAVYAGCSQSPDITSPVESRLAELGEVRSLWGLYQFSGTANSNDIEIVPLRSAAIHLNAVPLLEPAPPFQLYVGLQGPVQVTANSIKCNIKLEHPMAGQTKYAGFDVCGILIGHGSESPYSDPDIVIAGPGDVRLLNADGYTRWWNPVEFTLDQGNIMAYNDGFLGVPHSYAQFTATLNGYKYFADGVGPDDKPTVADSAMRGAFSPGTTNVRHYDIEFDGGEFLFNYAVDASWSQPTEGPPYFIPDSFPPFANRNEAWFVEVNVIDNGLWNDGVDNGGTIDLNVYVYDHYLPDDNIVRVESPGNFATKLLNTATSTHVGYAVYEFNITDATPSEESIEIFVTAQNSDLNYGGLVPGKYVSTYTLKTVGVSPYGAGVDTELVMDVLRNDYGPPGPSYPQSWITGIFLDWSTLPNSAQYAVYRASLWSDPYNWEFVASTIPAVTEYTNTTDDTVPVDFDADYIYEVRPRSVADDPNSEGAPTERAYVIMESNDDDNGEDPLNPRWESIYGSGNTFHFGYHSLGSSDEGTKNKGILGFSTLRPNSWEVTFPPNPLPDINGQSYCAIDFAFSTFLGTALPSEAGFAPGVMTSLPVQDADHALTFSTIPFSNFEDGQAYTNSDCAGLGEHFGGNSNWAYSGAVQNYRAARFKLPKMLEPDTNYVGIGIASFNSIQSYAFDLGLDSIAIFVY